MKYLSFFIFLILINSCSSWYKIKNAHLTGIWVSTELTNACRDLVDSGAKFKNIPCGIWNDYQFYIEHFFHVQALNFKKRKEETFLFKGRGEMTGGACVMGISPYVAGKKIMILTDKIEETAKGIVFQMGAIHITKNKDVKGFCALKFDNTLNKWCAIGNSEHLEDAKGLVEENLDCF